MVKMRLYLPSAVLIILIMKDTLAEADADPDPEFAINQILKRGGKGKKPITKTTTKPTTKKPRTTVTPPPTTTTAYEQTDTFVSTKATLDKPYDPQFANTSSPERKALDQQMENAMDETLKDTVDGYKGYKVTGVSPGGGRRKRSTGGTVVEGSITLDKKKAKPGAMDKIKNSGAELGKALNTTVSVEAEYECKYDGKTYKTGATWTNSAGQACSCSADGSITGCGEKVTTPDPITTQPSTTTTTEPPPETPTSQPKERIYFD